MKSISKDNFIALVYNLKDVSYASVYKCMFKCNLLMKGINPITPCDSDSKESAGNAETRFNPWVRRITWRREWQPLPVLAWEIPDRDIVHGVTKSQT